MPIYYTLVIRITQFLNYILIPVFLLGPLIRILYIY